MGNGVHSVVVFAMEFTLKKASAEKKAAPKAKDAPIKCAKSKAKAKPKK